MYVSFVFLVYFASVGIYFFKVNNGSIKTVCEIYSRLTRKTPNSSGFFIFNFEQILHIAPEFSLMNLNIPMSAGTAL